MKELRISTQRILEEISTKFPGQTDFRRAIIEDVAKSMGFTAKDYYPLLKPENRVKIGTYSLDGLLPEPTEQAPAATDKIPATAAQMQSIVSDEKSYATVDPTFVPWGSFKDITQIIKSEMFYPTYVSGLSGNGKTFMIEQACAKIGKEFIRVQINPETDEDDLMIINKSGIAIRMEISTLRIMGRATQGVKLINLKGDDTIAAVAKVMKDDDPIEDVNDLEVNDGTIIE